MLQAPTCLSFSKTLLFPVPSLLCFITSTSVPRLCPIPLHQLFTIHIPILPAGQMLYNTSISKKENKHSGSQVCLKLLLIFCSLLRPTFQKCCLHSLILHTPAQPTAEWIFLIGSSIFFYKLTSKHHGPVSDVFLSSPLSFSNFQHCWVSHSWTVLLWELLIA